MSSSRASKAAKSSINYHQLALGDNQLFGPDALLTKDNDADHQPRQSPQSGRTYTDTRLTTPEFVSALTGIWSLIGESESSCTTQRSKIHGTSTREDTVCFSRIDKDTPLCAATSSGLVSENCSSTPKLIYEDLNSVKKTLMMASFTSVGGASSTWRHKCSVNEIGGAHFLQFGNMYCMQTVRMGKIGPSESSKRNLSRETYAPTDMAVRNDDSSSQPRSIPAELCTSSNGEAYTAHGCESSLHDNISNLEIFQEDTELSVYSVHQKETIKEARIMPGNQISNEACTKVQLHELTCPPSLVDNAVVNSTNADQYAYGDYMYEQHSVDKCSHELRRTFQHRYDGAFAVNRHAVAGALAGSVVSVSLHPVDTVKTLIQANSSGQSSFYHTLRRILVERGNT